MTRRVPDLVTVALPALDEEHHIGRQLAALASQTYAGEWEVVIADNGCTDRTVEIALGWRDRLPALRIADATACRGVNHARNVAADAAAGDLLAFCDADDVATPGWLSALANAAPDADLLGGALDPLALNSQRTLDGHDRPSASTELPVAHGFLPYVPGGNCGVWTDVARELSWDESFRFGSSDIDFSWRAQLAGHSLAFVAGAVMHRRLDATLPRLGRRFYRYGRADPRLHRRYARAGMRRPGTGDDAIPVWRLLTEAPRLPASHAARGAWVTALARALGRAAGTRRPARPARRRPADLLEVDVTWPPETFLQWKLKGLAERGLGVSVAATPQASEPRAEIPGVGLERVPRWDEPKPRKAAGLLTAAVPLALERPGRALALARASHRATGSLGAGAGLVRRFARLARTRAAVAHFEWERAAIDHLPLIETWSRPVVVSSHGGLAAWPFTGADERRLRLLPAMFEQVSVIHCVCEDQREEATRLGADPAKLRVIRQGVDPGTFVPQSRDGLSDGALHLASVGRLVWEKGWEYLIESMRLLRDAGVHAELRIAGDGPERERIEVMVAELALEPQVTLLGAQPVPAVRALLQRSDAFALSSVVEGLPVAMLEAMACGLAVVATDCGGIREAVDEGTEGSIVPPRAPAAMARALEGLAADPERRRQMGQAARRRVAAEFTLERQLDEFQALYGELAAAPP